MARVWDSWGLKPRHLRILAPFDSPESVTTEALWRRPGAGFHSIRWISDVFAAHGYTLRPLEEVLEEISAARAQEIRADRSARAKRQHMQAAAAHLVLMRTIRRLQDRASMNDRNAEAPGKTDREFWESRARAQAYLVAARDLHEAIDDLSEELERLKAGG